MDPWTVYIVPLLPYIVGGLVLVALAMLRSAFTK